MAFRYPGTRYAICREVRKTLLETTYRTFLEITKILGWIPEYHFTIRQGGAYVKLMNGSQIWFKELSRDPNDPDYQRLGSLELTAAFIDECTEVEHLAMLNLYTRIRYKLRGTDVNGDAYSVVPTMLMTCNPAKGWVYKEYYAKWRADKLHGDDRFIQSLVTDNPFIDPHYIENLRNTPNKSIKERLLYGNWDYDDDPTLLMTYDAIQACWTNSFVQDPVRDSQPQNRFISADIAFYGSDKFVVGIWYGWTLVKIVVQEKTNPKEVEPLINHLAQQHRVPRRNIVYDAEGLGNYLRGYLPNAYPFRVLDRPKRDKTIANLKSECAIRLSQLVMNDEVYFKAEMTEKNKTEIAEELSVLKNAAQDKDGKIAIQRKDELKELLGRSPDYADMIIMRTVFEVLKPLKGLSVR